jgi:hypothetical protein
MLPENGNPRPPVLALVPGVWVRGDGIVIDK